MKKISVLFLLFIGSCTLPFTKKAPVYLGDMIYLNSGEEYHCLVKEINDKYVIIETAQGLKKLPISKVMALDLQKRRKGYQWKNINEIDDPVLIKALKTDLSKFTGMGYINILIEKKLVINPDSTYTIIIRGIRGIVDDKGRTAGNLSFTYSHNNEKLFIDFARTITSEGRVLHIREIAIEDASSFSQFPSYDNLHSRKFAMREVKPGNFLDYQVRIEGKYADNLPLLFDKIFADKGPTLTGKIIVQYPENLNIDIYYKRIGNPTISSLMLNGYSYKVLTFDVNNINPVFKVPMMPPEGYFSPRVVVGLEDKWKNISYTFKKSLNPGKTNISGKSPKEIYSKVLRGIKYVEVPSNTYSVIPKNPTETINNKYGNCLDKAFVLYTALRENGFNADLILVRSKFSGPLADGIPVLSQFDGALVKCKNVILDPANESIPFGYVRPKYQGTKGLSIGKGEIVDIPYLSLDNESSMTDRIIHLSTDGSGKVKEILSFKGNNVLFFRNWKYLRKEERKKQLESYINSILSNVSLIDYKIEHLNDLNPEMKIILDYTVPNIATKEGRYLLLHIPGINYSAYYVGAPKRPYPVFYENLSLDKNRVIIYLPRGYRVRYIPAGFTYKSKPVAFESSLKKTKRYIEYNDTYTIQMGLIPIEKYPEYRRCIMKMAEMPNRWIILER